MVKDKRYNTVKKLILANALSSFTEIFDTLPKTVVGRDLGMHHQTFTKLLADPKRFTFEQAFSIAGQLEVDPLAVVNLIAIEILGRNKGKKRG